jgi:hypothetical protein
LHVHALHRANAGDLRGALDSVQALWNCGRSLESDPLLFSYMISAGCKAAAASALERVLTYGQVDDERLQGLAALCDSPGEAQRFGSALVGDRITSLEVYSAMLPNRSLAIAVRVLLPGLLDLNKVKTLRMYNRLIETLEKSPVEALRRVQITEEEVENLSPIYWPARVLSQPWIATTELCFFHQAVQDCLAAALAAERYRLASGEWPDSLEALVPLYMTGVPNDPFDGEPIRYLRTDAGITIYSIGRDGVDDGGELDVPRGERAPDQGFRLLDPQLRHRAGE